jgi:hypothetical protein
MGKRLPDICKCLHTNVSKLLSFGRFFTLVFVIALDSDSATLAEEMKSAIGNTTDFWGSKTLFWAKEIRPPTALRAEYRNPNIEARNKFQMFKCSKNKTVKLSSRPLAPSPGLR